MDSSSPPPDSPESHKTDANTARTTHWQRYLIAGVITIIPLWITWLVFRFILTQLQQLGRPGAKAMTELVQRWSPSLTEVLSNSWVQNALAVVLTLVLLYLLGWLTSRMIGRKLLQLLDSIVRRIPLAHTVYGSTKKLMAALQDKPKDVQRVVLIAFPTPEMKTIGFVTRVIKDQHTGQSLAAVYVPTTPNPTSGYLEIVPLASVISTDWSVDQAMSFIISGGAVAPESIQFTQASPEKHDSTETENKNGGNKG